MLSKMATGKSSIFGHGGWNGKSLNSMVDFPASHVTDYQRVFFVPCGAFSSPQSPSFEEQRGAYLGYSTLPLDVFVFPINMFITHRIHGAAIYGNMDPINIPQMLAYIPAPWILWVILS